ncbi:MAG: carbohydrate-binding family 9-like protein [Thermoproteota archaeon]
MYIRKSPFPCPEENMPHYTAYHIDEPIQVDGRLDEACWQVAPRTSRFVDLMSGRPTIYDTYAAILWDEENLYIGFWVEEPLVVATFTERDSPIYDDNDVELFITSRDAYYEFEINALGTIYEVLFIWEDAYEKAGYAKLPEFQRDGPKVRQFPGVGFKDHPRGSRLGFWNWDLPGLRSAVYVDGTLNKNQDRDRGWTVELALPWKGMKALVMSDNRSLPPRDGDIWRMNLFRFNQYREAPPAQDSGGWAWGPHYVWDSHVPECYPFIHFSRRLVTETR